MGAWDDPEYKMAGNFVKFDEIGDSVTGRIVAIRKHRFDDGSVAPQVFLVTENGEEKTLTAGQVKLRMALVEQRPEVGDVLTVTYAQKEKRTGGKTLKHFDVKITKGTGAAGTFRDGSSATDYGEPPF